MASDLISRDALRDVVKSWYWNGDLHNAKDDPAVIDAMTDLTIRTINKAPAVDAVEVVRCEKCAHKREENGVLRCPYSTVDLDPKGYCSRGIPMAMAAKAPLDEHVKKAITEGEWGDQA